MEMFEHEHEIVGVHAFVQDLGSIVLKSCAGTGIGGPPM
jgi:hypothetical protein